MCGKLYSIGKLCREFNLSRSTLLYYSKIGLLVASKRTQSNYRQYSQEDKQRLSQICALREAGVPLAQIKSILEQEGRTESDVLERRLTELNQEIRYLRLQQKLIVEMLQAQQQTDLELPMDGTTFVSILKSIGFDSNTLDRFHLQFEQNAPNSHQLFLEFLGRTDEEIKRIREFGSQVGA